MEKVKEISQEEKEMQAEKAFRETPLGRNITQLESHVENHLVDMLTSVGIGVTDEQRTDMMTNFIAASHAAGTIQRLVWHKWTLKQKIVKQCKLLRLKRLQRKQPRKKPLRKIVLVEKLL